MKQQGQHKQRSVPSVTVVAARNALARLGLNSTHVPPDRVLQVYRALRLHPDGSAYDYGYVAGYKDQHKGRAVDHRACERDGYLQWLAGWREGQKHRRRDFPPEAMRYEPRWPVPLPPSPDPTV